MSFSKLMTLSQLKAIGVKDERWTVHDKLLMYKGLTKMYNREGKNQIKDMNVLKKKNHRKIIALQQEIKDLQEHVSTTMHGDTRCMRRLLYNHKELQLTYQNLSPEKVSEDLNHRIFCRKKHLNMIRFKKNNKEQRLLELQVGVGDLEHKLKNDICDRTDLTQQALTNDIQNYVVKFCAAKNIQNVYKRMLAVLYKDQRYYEAILVTLQNDSNLQHKCLIRATEMGQLAMEEMANMKSEYTRLEKEVRINMIERERSLKEIRDRLVDLYEESQGLVRTESEFDMQMMQEEPKKKGKPIEEELRELDELLLKMQDVTLVPKFSDIFPRMLETLRQKKRLLEQLELNAAACDDMLNKKNHAELMFYSLYHTGAEATADYQTQAEDIQSRIEKQKNRLGKILCEQEIVSKQSADLRVGLQRLCNLLEEVRTPGDFVDHEVPQWPVKDVAISLRPKAEDDTGRLPMNEESQRLLRLLDIKMKYIKSKLKEVGDTAEQERAFVARFKHVSENISGSLYPDEGITEAPALILDIVLEDPQVPNRLEIKARSQEIYAEATRNPFDVPEASKSKKSKKK